MARPLRIEYPGAFYHVTSRGNERKDIFKSVRDREKFLSFLESAVTRYGAVIHAYCLMSNHYHLLVETPQGNLSQIMRHINGAYTTYFNIKHSRSGHLFQGRYKAILVEADEYATELSRYIHLNPVRAALVSKPEEYHWSSYRSYTGQGKTIGWLNTDFILSYFAGNSSKAPDHYRKFVEALLTGEYESPLKEIIASTLLGRPEFVDKISNQKLCELRDERNVPALKALRSHPSMDKIITTIKAESIDEKFVRKISIYCCHKYSGAKLKEIGERFRMSDAAIAQTSKRLSLKAEKNSETKKLLERIEAKLTSKVET
ncbi:REP-associated tyrosine transposase [Desulfofustis glycolicus]|uniref:REP element-mobilizing transposase RayT n=1 Tax=Desulfofustis glycolicus DSM 9705 TaxID=1121409 RepID=A0A1M5YP60_9BACT|nr:transposase [Desulfofustis glycolicus]MCB2217809.1 transposase [Desulfobulbaceae bacterium]SHI13701.1 REP element-mobilizing transposase RayT [Desulfofustis glycolicus DSM 9705]